MKVLFKYLKPGTVFTSEVTERKFMKVVSEDPAINCVNLETGTLDMFFQTASVEVEDVEGMPCAFGTLEIGQRFRLVENGEIFVKVPLTQIKHNRVPVLSINCISTDTHRPSFILFGAHIVFLHNKISDVECCILDKDNTYSIHNLEE